MNYLKQVTIVTSWEYSRFFKPKKEAIGILIMLAVSVVFYFAGRFALSGSDKKMEITVFDDMDEHTLSFLGEHYMIRRIPAEDRAGFLSKLNQEQEMILLEKRTEGYGLYAWKNTRTIKKLKSRLNECYREEMMRKAGLDQDELTRVLSPAPVVESFLYKGKPEGRLILSFFFAGLMIMAVFLSFAYQFTAITGEKQLKITEQIVSAITPQVWMDGKIFGITLTGISSMFTWAVLSIFGGMLFFQFTGSPVGTIFDYLHLPSILLYLPFALAGILIWNAILAAVASVITDPNNSAKSSLMLLPLVFVLASFLVPRDPDSGTSVFLSWFPLTSATAMPMRWAMTEVAAWQLCGSFMLLAMTFYFFRRLAAKIFRISILITGKEPSWSEIYDLSKKQ